VSGGTPTLIAGNGTVGHIDNATGTSAELNNPQGIALSLDHNYLYVSEAAGNYIRTISLTAPYAVTTLAGNGAASNSNGTTALNSAFDGPRALLVTGTGYGTIYVIDNLGVPSVTDGLGTAATGDIRTLTLSSDTAANPPGTVIDTSNPNVVSLNGANGMVLGGPSGTMLYVTNSNVHQVVEISTLSGHNAQTIAGNGTAGHVNNANGSSAEFNTPTFEALSASGNYLYIAGYLDNSIRVVNLISGNNFSVTDVAGNGTAGNTGDNGAALSATLNGPRGVVVGPDGSLYVADYGNGRIRKVAPLGW
jgi:hypothetical protein